MEENQVHQPQPSVQSGESSPPSTGQKPSTLPKAFIIVLVLLLIGVLGSLGYFFVFSPQQNSNKAPEKIYRIGILSGLDFFMPVSDGFKQKMTELGYIEGKNIVYDIKRTNIEPEKERKNVQMFIKDDVDLILSSPTEISIIAKEELKNSHIPLVFAGALIEQGGLIESVSHTGGNLSGVRFPGPENSVGRLEVLHELVPTAKRILVPYLDGYPNVPPELEALKKASKLLELQLVQLPVKSPQDIEAYLQEKVKLKDKGFDAILLIVEPVSVMKDTPVILGKYTNEYNIPFGGSIMLSDSESLFAYNADLIDIGKLSAIVADKILSGTSADSIAVSTPNSYLQINYKAATKQGITVNQKLLNSAKEIIR